jgi:hypothetical protein
MTLAPDPHDDADDQKEQLLTFPRLSGRPSEATALVATLVLAAMAIGVAVMFGGDASPAAPYALAGMAALNAAGAFAPWSLIRRLALGLAAATETILGLPAILSIGIFLLIAGLA